MANHKHAATPVLSVAKYRHHRYLKAPYKLRAENRDSQRIEEQSYVREWRRFARSWSRYRWHPWRATHELAMWDHDRTTWRTIQAICTVASCVADFGLLFGAAHRYNLSNSVCVCPHIFFKIDKTHFEFRANNTTRLEAGRRAWETYYRPTPHREPWIQESIDHWQQFPPSTHPTPHHHAPHPPHTQEMRQAVTHATKNYPSKTPPHKQQKTRIKYTRRAAPCYPWSAWNRAQSRNRSTAATRDRRCSGARETTTSADGHPLCYNSNDKHTRIVSNSWTSNETRRPFFVEHLRKVKTTNWQVFSVSFFFLSKVID